MVSIQIMLLHLIIAIGQYISRNNALFALCAPIKVQRYKRATTQRNAHTSVFMSIGSNRQTIPKRNTF